MPCVVAYLCRRYTQPCGEPSFFVFPHVLTFRTPGAASATANATSLMPRTMPFLVYCIFEGTPKDLDAVRIRYHWGGLGNHMAPPRKRRPAFTPSLAKLADLIEGNIDILSTLEALDNGKAFNRVKHGDVSHSINCIRYYIRRLGRLRQNPRPNDRNHGDEAFLHPP